MKKIETGAHGYRESPPTNTYEDVTPPYRYSQERLYTRVV